MIQHSQKMCPQCRRRRWIPLATAPYCTRSCQRAACDRLRVLRACQVCYEVHDLAAKTITCIRDMWRCVDEAACASRAIAQTTRADRAAMFAALDQSWDSLAAEGWRWPRLDGTWSNADAAR